MPLGDDNSTETDLPMPKLPDNKKMGSCVSENNTNYIGRFISTRSLARDCPFFVCQLKCGLLYPVCHITHDIPTVEPAFIERQSTIRRSFLLPKMSGQKTRNKGDLNEPAIK